MVLAKALDARCHRWEVPAAWLRITRDADVARALLFGSESGPKSSRRA